MHKDIVEDHEYLFRGVVVNNWDFENNRPSSATFKDSFGVSVDRDGGRSDKQCIEELIKVKNFQAVCKVLTKDVRDQDALVLYKPTPVNKYHSEIHDSANRIPLRGKKPNRIREKSIVVFSKIE